MNEGLKIIEKVLVPNTPKMIIGKYFHIFHLEFFILYFLTNHFIKNFNKPNFPFNGGYFTAGSNQVGVFITAFL